MLSVMDFSSVGERVGLSLIATSGLLSAISTFTLLSYFIFCYIQVSIRNRQSSPLSTGITNFTRSSLGKYLLYLLMCDFVQGIAFVANYWWAVKGKMDNGPLCTYQGAVSQVGDLGAALWANVIAFQTFWLLFLQRRPPKGTEAFITVLIWSALIALPILGPAAIQTDEDGPFWGLSGAWCWVGGGYQLSRLLYLYVWVFFNLISCLIIYSLIYLKFAGLLDYDSDRWYKLVFSLHRPKPLATRTSVWLTQAAITTGQIKSQSQHSGNGSNSPGADLKPISLHAAKVARRLMWYPIAYAIVTVPVAICRLGVLSGWQPPFPLFVVAGTTFASSGFTNTILFLVTRHSFIQRTMNAAPVVIATTRQVEVCIDDGTGSVYSYSYPSPAKVEDPFKRSVYGSGSNGDRTRPVHHLSFSSPNLLQDHQQNGYPPTPVSQHRPPRLSFGVDLQRSVSTPTPISDLKRKPVPSYQSAPSIYDDEEDLEERPSTSDSRTYLNPSSPPFPETPGSTTQLIYPPPPLAALPPAHRHGSWTGPRAI